MRESERESEKERESEREKARERERVSESELHVLLAFSSSTTDQQSNRSKYTCSLQKSCTTERG